MKLTRALMTGFVEQQHSWVGTPEKGKSIPAQLVSGMMSR